MLKYGEINPLNVFGLRRMDHCPPHFEKVHFDLRTSEKHITDWIYEHLIGRFWFGDFYDDKNTLCKCAAFETKSEASYFMLMIDSFNVYQS
jgi:hypothetical protein